MKKVQFSQLWHEEEALLFKLATRIPDNGTIVEIGTAQGGSSVIFDKATRRKGVKIFSFDIEPSLEAYENLKNTNVKIIAKSSMDGVKMWEKRQARLIDFLFIDGSHTLQHVFEDFNNWVRFLKPGGTVVLHDYDPVQRGGVAHFALRIMVDAIKHKRLLSNRFHLYRLFGGVIADPASAHVSQDDCVNAINCLANLIRDIYNKDYRGWSIIGEKRFVGMVKVGLKNGHGLRPISSRAIISGRRYMVVARPIDNIIQRLSNKRIPPKSFLIIDDLVACYLLANMLKNKRNYLLDLTPSRATFFKWEEVLFMFEHAIGSFRFPYNNYPVHPHTSIINLSKLIALEQVRLVSLSHLLETLISKYDMTVRTPPTAHLQIPTHAKIGL